MNLINRSVLSALLVGMTVFSFSGCAEEFSIGSDTRIVLGWVEHAQSATGYSTANEPADGVAVVLTSLPSLTTYEASTNADGYYEIASVPQGLYMASFTKDGYQDPEEYFTLDNSNQESEGTHRLDISLWETEMTASIALYDATLSPGMILDQGVNNDRVLPTFSIASPKDIVVVYSLVHPEWDATAKAWTGAAPTGPTVNGQNGTSTDGKTWTILGADIATSGIAADNEITLNLANTGLTPIHEYVTSMEGRNGETDTLEDARMTILVTQ